MKVSQYKRADKAVTIDQFQNPIVVGNNLTYTLGVTNNGPQLATGSGFPTRFRLTLNLFSQHQIKAPQVPGKRCCLQAHPT